MRSHLEGCIVVSKGKVQDKYGLPLLWMFNKSDKNLLQLARLPATVLAHATLFYRRGNWDDCFHSQATPPPPKWHGETIMTFRGLIPIPVGWAPLFLDYLSMGAAF